MINIVSPRPPLNLFEAVRMNADATWKTVYEVPQYVVPASGPTPERTIGAAAIMTGLIISNTGEEFIEASVRITGTDAQTYPLVVGVPVPTNDFAFISLDRQVMKSGEKLEIQCGTGQTAVVHFTFILNQREEYTEIV